jgi:rare lipoprotein A
MTAAHPTLPMGTKAKVTNLENGKKVEVRINDRGPYADDRVIDLSGAAAKKLDMKEGGTAEVKIETKPTKMK